jgi:hypothetical protein
VPAVTTRYKVLDPGPTTVSFALDGACSINNSSLQVMVFP